MTEGGPRPTTIDQYIAGFPEEVRTKLEAVRRAVRKAAPEATEAMKRGVPAFLMQGRTLVHFGAFGDALVLYPVPATGGELSRELAGYRQGKGSARFPLDQPLPLKLIAQIVAARSAATLEKAFARSRSGR